METDEISERYIAPFFVNGLEAYEGKVNLQFEENLISNEYTVKLCLDNEVKKGKKLVKKELTVTLKGELYFVKFIINPEEDDSEPEVILGISFLRLAHGVVDFVNKSNRNKKRTMENLNLFYQDIGQSSSAGGYLTQEEAKKEALAKDKVELDGKTLKEEEDAVKRIKGDPLKEKDDPGAFIFSIRLERKLNKNALADTGSDINTMPYRIYETLGRKEMKKIDKGITMINHTQEKAMGKLSNVLCQVGVTTIIAKFLIMDIPIDRDAPIMVGRGFLYTMGSILNTLDRLFLTFDGVCHQTFRAARFDVLRTVESDSDDEEEYVIKRNSVWKKAVSFLGSLPVPLKQVNWKPDYKGAYTKEEEAAGQKYVGFFSKPPHFSLCPESTPHFRETSGTHDGEAKSSRSKRPRQHETVEEVLLPQVHHEFLLCKGCSRDAKSRYNTKLAQLLPRHIYSPCIVNWDVLNRMGCDGEIDDMLRIRLHEAGSDEKIFTSVVWIRAFNINEPVYVELCYEFYSTYEFDEVCAGDELQSKKIIRFRLGGRAQNLTLLEFSRRLGLYQVTELEEEGFNIYFEGGLHSDEHFNAQDYCLSIGREEHLGLSRSHTFTIRNLILRVIHKMITYAWVITKWMKRKGDGTQKESQIYCGQFILKHAKKCRVLTEDVPGVPRVGILRPPRASIQDLYDKRGRMKIRQEAIEHIEYRQSYHWDSFLELRNEQLQISHSSLRLSKYFRFDCLRANNKLSMGGFNNTPNIHKDQKRRKGLTMQRNPVTRTNGRYKKDLEENYREVNEQDRSAAHKLFCAAYL
nr:hypothetical protein [Tanacetum cinerariifolium]